VQDTPDDVALPFYRGLLAIPDCTGCPLQGAKIVPPEGNPRAKLAIIGEGPGYNEEQELRPFVGAAGQHLNRMLADAGIIRSEVWVSNSALCVEGTTQIRMSDGSRCRINEIVAKQLRGPVKTLKSDGTLSSSLITGWYRNHLNGREMCRINFSSARLAGDKGISAGSFTVDHPFLTPHGWVPAGDIDGELIATGQIALQGRSLQVFIGTLLGAACIPKNRSALVFAHANDQRSYALLKAKSLSPLMPTISELPPGVNNIQHQTRVSTHASRWIATMRTAFYPNGIKGISNAAKQYLNHLDILGLAVWFCDDGYTCLRETRRPLAEIATCAFSQSDVAWLSKLVNDKGFECHLRQGHGWRIAFTANGTQRLLESLAKFIPPDLDYKLPSNLRGKFDKEAYLPTPPTTYWDRAATIKSTPRRPNGVVYCIDVAETGNFVTMAGIVHNCKPRTLTHNGVQLNPDQVVKLSAQHCRTRLINELAIVKPRVVVGLGAVALRSLYDTNAKIMERRGAIHEIDIAPITEDKAAS